MSYTVAEARATPINGEHVRQPVGRCAVGRRGVLRHPKLNVDVEAGPVTAFGGLVAAAGVVRRLKIAEELNSGLRLLRSHRPYRESDHVLTHVYNLYLGGTCIEDVGRLQSDEGARRLLGAAKIPDPTTAGDFLRRFESEELAALNNVIDVCQEKVWKKRYRRKKAAWGVVDLDSHVKKVYGAKKEGADFSYKKCWGYHPLVVSMAGSQEILRLVNRSGNRPSAEGAADTLRELLPMVQRFHRNVLVRGDSAFYDNNLIRACEEHGAYYALVVARIPNLVEIAENLDESAFKPYTTRTSRVRKAQRKTNARRKKRRERRRATAKKRGKRDLKLCRQWVAEVPYKPARADRPGRLIIRKRLIEETSQLELVRKVEYRFCFTNLPKSVGPKAVVDRTYERCDQENIIEQLQHGVAAMRMPTGTLLANAAFMCCARLAFNLKSWLAQLTDLPAEVMRWEWKRFRFNFVIIAATASLHARRTHVRLHSAHPSVTRLGRVYQSLLH